MSRLRTSDLGVWEAQLKIKAPSSVRTDPDTARPGRAELAGAPYGYERDVVTRPLGSVGPQVGQERGHERPRLTRFERTEQGYEGVVGDLIAGVAALHEAV